MHQSGHSRAQSMQTVQFSSSSAITPRERGGSSGETSGYCWVCDPRVIVRKVTASPLASPLPGTAAPLLEVMRLILPVLPVQRENHAPQLPRANHGHHVRLASRAGHNTTDEEVVVTAALEEFYTPPDGWTTDDLDALPEDGVRR